MFRGPHSLYRRYQALLESAATAAGFALLVTLALTSMGSYPDKWVIVIGVGIGVIGVRWPLLAYGLAVAVMAYPIYTINFYLAVLFIAVGVLGHRLFVHYLGATVLVLAVPLLAEYHLHWLVPILGGLWWGGAVGMWVGGLGAVWGKFVPGMAGVNTDSILLAGQVPGIELLANRFQNANSLDTLLLLVEPFATTSNVLLYNLLQVVGWMLAGGFVGTLASRRWVKHHAPWSILVITAGGGLILMATHVALPYWLPEIALPMAAYDPIAPLFAMVIVILVGTVVYSLRESLDLPVAPPRRLSTRQSGVISRAMKAQPLRLFRRPAKSPGGNAGTDSLDAPGPARRPVRVPTQNELPEWEPPKNDSGLIMLEID